ncbi:MAG: hypothetical protein M1839_004941 [Geoglossum umbratile]|nr:MAG: hypothetical protein M1839_004941 [Geoglossum umbratile]
MDPDGHPRQNDNGSGYQAVQEIVTANLATAKLIGETEHQRLPTISKERRLCCRDETAFDLDSFPNEVAGQQTEGQGTVLYLAYGSNLCDRAFRGVRGIRPIAQLNVLVPELALTFDLPGIAYNEPCFANVRYWNEPRVEPSNIPIGLRTDHSSGEEEPPKYHKDRWKKGLVGVVYEVSKKDYVTIIATEGGAIAYKDVVVTCYPLPETKVVPERPQTSPFKAHTLFAPGLPGRIRRTDPGYAQPSARYLKLLSDGADEHSLPEEYKLYLHDIRPYTITTDRQRFGRFLFLAVWMPMIYIMFLLQRIFKDKHGRSPKWLAEISGAMFRAMWSSYDRFFKPVFGDGERTIGQDMASC